MLNIKNIFKNIFNSKVKRYDQEILDMFNFNDSAKGVTKPYSQHHVVYVAIKTIAQACAQIPLLLYDAKNNVISQGDVFELLNNSQSLFELIESIITYLNLNGEAFIYTPQSVGQSIGTYKLPASLQSLSPKHITHNKDNNGVVTEWIFNNKILIDPLEIIHIKLFNPYNSIRGLSPIESIIPTLDSDHYADRWNKSFFKNSAMPSSVLTLDKDAEVNVAVLKKLKKQLIDNYQGSSNAHMPMLLQGGMSWESLSLSHREMEFLESKKLNRNDILSIYGVPAFVAGYTDQGDTNKATSDTASYIFYVNTVVPLLKRLESAFNKDFNQRFKTNLTCKFNVSDIGALKRDYSQRVIDAVQLITHGFSRDEVVNQLDLGFDDVDDTRYLPMNLIPIDYSIDNNRDNKNIKSKSFNINYYRNYKRLHSAHERIFNSKLKRFFFEQRSSILNIISNKNINTSNTTSKDYMSVYNDLQDYWAKQDEELINKVKPIFQNIHDDSVKLASSVIPQSTPIDMSIINSKANKIVDINQTTWSQLRKTLYEGYAAGENITDISARVKQVFNITTKRALVIARTETTSMINETTFKHYDNEGLQNKTWVGGERPTHAAQDGMTIPINQRFPNGLLYPGDDGPAAEVINCRCCIAPSV